MILRGFTALALALVIQPALADGPLTVTLAEVNTLGSSAIVGTVSVTVSPYGLVFTPDLKGLAPGVHGFHVHMNPNCGTTEVDGRRVPGGGAGPHYDPLKAGKHGAPWGDGHLGDLPALYVAADGTSTQAVLAPRLKLADLAGRSLMIHAGGDNHDDHPMPLGGGGARVACGVVPG